MTFRINNEDDPIIGPPTNIDWDTLLPPPHWTTTLKETILITILVTLTILFWATFIAGINALWIN